ncbi:MAG: SagB/ThcOx family dehydrogenase [Bacteroidota bacterium]|nr:SagB/ThcOx family dehydrogenase [Bacteroidota bacterium]
MKLFFIALMFSVYAAGMLNAQALVNLPAPQKTGGMPLMEALSKRTSIRSYSDKELSMQQISNLLWASFGVNRPNGKRTAPSAMNKQEIDIYVLLKQGAYIYDAQANTLKLVIAEDLRAQSAPAAFAIAPVQLILVGDDKKGGALDVDCGYISQNIYLFCASEGLATCARGTFSREYLTKNLSLRPEQKIILAHSVGYPKQ